MDQFVNHITSDVFTMAMSRVGGTIIFNQKLPPLDDEYLQERSGHAKYAAVSFPIISTVMRRSKLSSIRYGLGG